ncbi:TPA: hypothetical protein TZM62_000228 [Streptococcus suis]|nr:hypothetical protein [Streptococcus suis]HEM4975106.1 hypothetical protein [Streptococcus suis]HEM5288950.1 hypothetical protein [Streptococcus suis]HEM5299141.1 hypothetical protein [Streptococcus suis]HEM5302680.1 hypothetical protein [Streptococcus suis]
MTTLLTIGFVAMSAVAFTAIVHGCKLAKQLNSAQFQQELVNEVLKERRRKAGFA